MEIYIHLDGSDFDDVAADVSSAIAAWITDSKSQAVLVTPVGGDDDDEPTEDVDLSDAELGIKLNVRKGRELKEPLNFLNKIAKKHKCVFVFGVYDAETGAKEDICYFGYEEAQPDLYEISTYIGIKV